MARLEGSGEQRSVWWVGRSAEKVYSAVKRHRLNSFNEGANYLVRLGAEVDSGAETNPVYAKMAAEILRKLWEERAEKQAEVRRLGVEARQAKAGKPRAREGKAEAAEGPIEPDRANTGHRASKAHAPAPARKKAK